MNSKTFFTSALVLAGVLTAGPAFAQEPAKPAVKVAPPKAMKPAPPPAKLFDYEELEANMKQLSAEMALLAPTFADFDRYQLFAGFDAFKSFADFDSKFTFDMAPGFGQSVEAREKGREDAERQRERERYEQGYEYVRDGRYDRGIERLNDVIAMKGSRTDAALYWKAYAQDRLGQRAEALTTLSTLVRDHSKSNYAQQAKVLEAEVRRNAGQAPRPQDQQDEEIKLLALNALQHQAPEQAVPMIQKLLAGTASPKLKERALFVLAQSDNAQAREVLKGIAKGGGTPELQSRAINYLGTHGGRESRAVLAEVYASTNDIDIKKRILRGFMVGGDKERVLSAAQSEQNAELRAYAVQQLGVMGAHAELWQLYQKESDTAVKKGVIRAMFVGGNHTRMTELAKAEQNPELRREAIRNLGLMGGKGNGDVLVEIYSSDRNADVRKAVVQALFVSNDAAALVTIARKEEDPVMKKEIISKLSHMNSKVAIDYMLELLNK
jgi:HEAT repeat protein